MAEAFTKHDVEILISTMDRQSLDFLEPMFPFAHFSEFNILVINQTKEGDLLNSDYPTVRVVNSFERGLSKSRNAALQYAGRKIILLTDDDVVFTEDFVSTILKSFNRHREAAAIRFMVSDNDGNVYKKYSLLPNKLDNRTILSSMSVELVYNRELVSGFKFDENFGLGALFPLGEEHVFLKELKNHGLKLLFEPAVIVKHPEDRNSDMVSHQNKFESVGAYFTRMFPKTHVLWILIFIISSFKHGKLSLSMIGESFKFAMAGSKKFKKVVSRLN